jgi:xylulokinase
LRDLLELARPLGARVERVRISGGGSRSALWRRIMADVFDSTVVTVNVTHGAAYGAALLAGVGAGLFESVPEACARVVRETGETRPGDDRAAYGEMYGIYRSLYPSLASSFRSQAAFEKRGAPSARGGSAARRAAT